MLDDLVQVRAVNLEVGGHGSTVRVHSPRSGGRGDEVPVGTISKDAAVGSRLKGRNVATDLELVALGCLFGFDVKQGTEPILC